MTKEPSAAEQKVTDLKEQTMPTVTYQRL